MWSSAIASRSPVVTPATARLRSSSRVRPTTRPAALMRSTRWRVLISTPRSRNTAGSARIGLLELGEDALRHRVDLVHAVDLDEQSAVAVHLEQGGGLLLADLLSAADDLLG